MQERLNDFPIFLVLCLFSGSVIMYFLRRYRSGELEVDDDIEICGDDQTRIRHEANL